jgi:hypothetical protein
MTRTVPDKPCTSLGRPPVSPDCAGCQRPPNPGRRTARRRPGAIFAKDESRPQAVWASLTLCVCYSLEDYLPRYRTEAAAITQAMPMGVSRQAAVYAGASVTAQRPI